eukprot:Rhum_TRINITY_DN15349_c4_g2::Rhum_TRINITY_DN15349_c4_g2_i4::g.153828::m.153828
MNCSSALTSATSSTAPLSGPTVRTTAGTVPHSGHSSSSPGHVDRSTSKLHTPESAQLLPLPPQQSPFLSHSTLPPRRPSCTCSVSVSWSPGSTYVAPSVSSHFVESSRPRDLDPDFPPLPLPLPLDLESESEFELDLELDLDLECECDSTSARRSSPLPRDPLLPPLPCFPLLDRDRDFDPLLPPFPCFPLLDFDRDPLPSPPSPPHSSPHSTSSAPSFRAQIQLRHDPLQSPTSTVTSCRPSSSVVRPVHFTQSLSHPNAHCFGGCPCDFDFDFDGGCGYDRDFDSDLSDFPFDFDFDSDFDGRSDFPFDF